MITLVPIKQTLEENQEFAQNPLCQDSLQMTIDFFNKIGYNPPWIGYYAKRGDELVGNAAYKGRPYDNTVEIAYGTFPLLRNQGIGTEICKVLVQKALEVNPTLTIIAHTMPETNFSTRILEVNNFAYIGAYTIPEDGLVWKWQYRGGE